MEPFNHESEVIISILNLKEKSIYLNFNEITDILSYQGIYFCKNKDDHYGNK